MLSNKSKFAVLGLLITMLVVSLTAGCSKKNSETPGIRIAALPILDSLPMYVAEKEGLFEKHGVNVELIPVTSAPERDQLLAAGEADGAVNELVSVLFFNRNEVKLQVVRYARTATQTTPVFRILASSASNIEALDDLKGIEIGVSQGTLIEYITDRLLENEGFTDNDIKIVSVPSIPNRLALLTSGDLKAAMLPDPLASLAIQQGAKVIIDDSSHPFFGYSVISFRKETIDAAPVAVKDFLAAIEDAVKLINQNPDKWNPLLTEYKLVPKPLLSSFHIPPFPEAGVPTKEQWQDVVDWTQAKGLIDNNPVYQDSVNRNLLP